MDVFAAVGSLVVTEGATAPLVLTAQLGQAAEGPDQPPCSPADRQSADAVFATHHREEANYSVPATLLVVSASVATLKSIAIDEAKSAKQQEDDEEAPRPGLPRNEKEEA